MGISILASLFSVLLVRFLMNPIYGFQTFLLIWLGCSGISSFLGFMIMGTHKIVIRYSTLRSLGRIATSVVLKTVILFPVVYFMHLHSSYSLRLLCVIDFLMTLAMLIIVRIFMIVIYEDMNKNMGRDVDRLRVVVLGIGEKSISLVSRLANSPHYMVIGFLTQEDKDGQVIFSKKVFTCRTNEEIARLRKDIGIEGVILPSTINTSDLGEGVLEAFVDNGIHVLTAPQISEISYNGFTQHEIHAISRKDDFIPDGMTPFERIFKRVSDCFLSGLLLIIFSPLFLICYLAIKFEDGGPAIFSQERIGRFGRPFMIYKFRSMRTDAEKMGPALYSGDNDARLTKVGRFIRAHHLDELPQLWNVFIGDMAFIGYRPERQFYIDQIVEHDPRYFYLYQIRPGVTSYATLKNGYTDTIEKMIRRLELDLYYLRNRSLWFDMKILLQTFLSIVFGKKF
ncbi:MAG: exopolysaccharide biosynthesis polyprenyl glycosylphosphotransferase [Bacteroidales bacterium]|nr:exopolysaccharide biosynthesis polyprenyl glycosylphosphotransferase [Bacteroidales bacterium]